jgi:Na+-driven multidrug efflux pump
MKLIARRGGLVLSPALMSRDLPNLADYRRLAGLAVPVVFVQVGLMVMGVVDTMIVGRVSPVALAGVAIGNVCVYALATLGMGMVTTPLVSRRSARTTSRDRAVSAAA